MEAERALGGISGKRTAPPRTVWTCPTQTLADGSRGETQPRSPHLPRPHFTPVQEFEQKSRALHGASNKVYLVLSLELKILLSQQA